MRASILSITFAIGTATALPALAQQTTSPDRQIQTDNKMQEEADKGIKTRDSGQSGFVGTQERPGASAHPPGQPRPAGQTTTGSGTSSSPR
jgi:hypothetical protein